MMDDEEKKMMVVNFKKENKLPYYTITTILIYK